MSQNDLYKLFEKCVEEIGLEKLQNILIHETTRTDIDSYSLTIIANQSFHNVPSRFIHGELYIASSGNLDFKSQEIIVEQYENILLKLIEKLSEKEWKKVYLIPTGHPTLALQVKSLVYHILRIDTIDLFYSKGDYYEIEINLRSLLKKSNLNLEAYSPIL